MHPLYRYTECSVSLGLMLHLHQESFGLLVKYELGLSQEEAERVDNLRFTWQKVLAQAVEVQNLLSRVQPYFR